MISKSSVVKLREDVKTVRYVDKMGLFSLATGASITVNITGAHCVELADGRRTVEEIAETLAKEFKTNKSVDDIIEDVIRFFTNLHSKGFVEVLNE